MGLRLGSLFDGSGGFPLAATLCGITPVWAAEVEPYPIAVTKTHFPAMLHLGDVSKVRGADIEPVDIITFGSPCQDMSAAGQRKGLKHTDNGDEETTRSGLFMEAIRIIREMREATNGIYPRFAVWENVFGAFSSNNGEDFRTVLQEFVQVREPEAVMPDVPKGGWPYADCYSGDGWSLAYRVYDAQYWGVPQRRRRIYLVADFGGQCAGEISFKRQGLRGYFETGRTPWKSLAENAGGCAERNDRDIVLDDQGGQQISASEDGVCPALRAQTHGNLPCVMQGVSIGNGQTNNIGMSEKANTLDCMHDKQAVIIPINDKATRYLGGGKSRNADGSGNGLGVGEDGDPAPTITAGDRHAVCCAVDFRNFTENENVNGTLQAKSTGGQSLNLNNCVRIRYIVRRLMQIECARLQGFPDNWGEIKHKDSLTEQEAAFWECVRETYANITGKAYKPMKPESLLKWYNGLHTDSSEYKMWGNGIALPNALYVMQGIADAVWR